MSHTWTDTAKEALEAHFIKITPHLTAAGADPGEVIEDLRRSIEREIAAEVLQVVTEADVHRLLAKLGSSLPFPDAAPAPPPAVTPSSSNPPLKRPGIWLFLAGIALPTIAIAIELSTGMCASAFFDPFPTLVHVAIAIVVPVANFLCWRTARTPDRPAPRWLAELNGAAIGISLLSSVQFLFLLLPGILAIFYFGIGLLPWAPLLALFAAVALRRHLRRQAAATARPPLPPLGRTATAAFALLFLVDATVWTTRLALVRAANPDAAVQQSGLSLLRTVGHHETLLRACYGRSNRARELDLLDQLLLRGRFVTPEQARLIYFRVTGHTFNSVQPPSVRTARGTPIDFNEWTWDADQGGENVGGRIRGLHLQQSRLDARVEANAALAYCEWTLEFCNLANQPHEARAQILLPPGGVVSRLTLWVNGQECEAAFASRSATRAAYQSVAIVQRRDPVLVTTAGPDRILMQCFPVPADGGTIKVRLGITSPLGLRDPALARFRWPLFIERNFSIPESLRHSLWLDSTDATSLACQGFASPTRNTNGLLSTHGELTEPMLSSSQSLVAVGREASVRQAWTLDTRSNPPRLVTASLQPSSQPQASALVVVLDGSVTMRHAARPIADALAALPDSLPVELLIARDAVTPGEKPALRSSPPTLQQLSRNIRRTTFAGGRDNLPALAQAWDLASDQPGSVIVWIHGPQPLQPGATAPLLQRLERTANGPRLVSFQIAHGPNRLAAELESLRKLESFPRLGDLDQDLRQLFADLSQPHQAWRHEWKLIDAPSLPASTTRTPATFHLARLWAHERIIRATATDLAPAQKLHLASTYQLVTPVSGAVVLETQQQFAQHNLQAAAQETVPTMPVPGLDVASPSHESEIASVSVPDTGSTALLLSLAIAGMALALRFRRYAS